MCPVLLCVAVWLLCSSSHISGRHVHRIKKTSHKMFVVMERTKRCSVLLVVGLIRKMDGQLV